MSGDYEALYQELLRRAEAFEPTAEDSAAAVLRAEVHRLRMALSAVQRQYIAEVVELRRERDEARQAAEHLWFHGEEHGVSHEEARGWYPWLYELHEQKQAERRGEQS